MKKFLLFFAFILTIQITVAQPPEYFVDNWYLHSFTSNDEVVSISELGITEGPTLIIKDNFTLYGSAFCNDYNGTFEYSISDPLGDNDHFRPQNMVRETEYCGDLEEMEDYFFIPFIEEKVADIYLIESSGNEKHIVLQYDFGYGYQEYKNFPALEIRDISIKDLIVYPNPVQDRLFIQSATDDFDSISISDINGRVVNSLKIVSNEIDVSGLQSGMYFLNIQSSEGKLTKKFIKN